MQKSHPYAMATLDVHPPKRHSISLMCTANLQDAQITRNMIPNVHCVPPICTDYPHRA